MTCTVLSISLISVGVGILNVIVSIHVLQLFLYLHRNIMEAPPDCFHFVIDFNFVDCSLWHHNILCDRFQ